MKAPRAEVPKRSAQCASASNTGFTEMDLRINNNSVHITRALSLTILSHTDHPILIVHEWSSASRRSDW